MDGAINNLTNCCNWDHGCTAIVTLPEDCAPNMNMNVIDKVFYFKTELGEASCPERGLTKR
jgi:hypothetical protein